MKKVERMLVPLDHSPGSEAIVDYACALALGSGATIALLHVYEPPNAMVGVVAGATIGGELAAEHAAGLELLARAGAAVIASGLAIPERILERAPRASEAIARHVQLGKFDLVVMGTHGRAGVSRWVLGSVADEVLHATPCPVLLVHLPSG
ncbi:MAG TPA: universal stress protein [Kofleriaceae bacterium]